MNTEALATQFEQHAFFKGMRQEDLTSLAECTEEVRFPAGETIFRFQDPADRFYVVQSGRIAIELLRPERDSTVLQTLGEGDVLGWSWLFPPHLWNFDARAVEDATCLALDGRKLRAMCDADPTFGYDLMKRFSAIIVRRLRATRAQLLDMFGD